MTHLCRLCGESQSLYTCKSCRIKTTKLTFVCEVDSHPVKGIRSLYSCKCGGKVVIYNGQFNSGNVRSCGCLLNQDKKQLLLQEEIPDNVRQYIQINTSSESLGNAHHRQWGSQVICPSCKTSRWQRNERIRVSIKKCGYPWVCQKCGGYKFMRKQIDPVLLKSLQEEYLKTDISWDALALKYEVNNRLLYERANGKLLTKVRRLKKRQQAVLRMEQEIINHEKAFLETQREQLSKDEAQIKILLAQL